MYKLSKYFHFVFKVASMGRRKANIALLVILGACILGGCPSKESSQPVMLKPGMPNTITLPNGEVVYDLNGEWEAVYDSTYVGSFAAGGEKESVKGIVKITQEGNKFVGIKVIGDLWADENQEAVQGELEKNRFGKLYVVTMGIVLEWLPGKGEISEDGNKIVIKARPQPTEIMTIVLKRK